MSLHFPLDQLKKVIQIGYFPPHDKFIGYRHYNPYLTYESRLHSFTNWPKSDIHKPSALAEAGFYYRKSDDDKKDMAECFECGIILDDWQVEDTPWERHAIYNPLCEYVQDKKGLKYIRSTREKREKLREKANKVKILNGKQNKGKDNVVRKAAQIQASLGNKIASIAFACITMISLGTIFVNYMAN